MAMPSTSSLILATALVGAALFALLRKEPSRMPSTFEPKPTPNEQFDPSIEQGDEDELPPNHPPIGGKDELPPNHPPIGGQGLPSPALEPVDDGPPALSWKAPANWTKIPNPNSMRLATYRVPAVAGARDEAELTVVRAGGTAEANVERWIGQFEAPEGIVRDKRAVNGLMVSTLEVRGTFRGGGMTATGPTESRPGWMLRGAVVESKEGLYFFKLTGPTASVVGARAGFDALLNSVAPLAKSAAE